MTGCNLMLCLCSFSFLLLPFPNFLEMSLFRVFFVQIQFYLYVMRARRTSLDGVETKISIYQVGLLTSAHYVVILTVKKKHYG